MSIDRGIHERRDANPTHMKVYSKAISSGFAKYFATYGKEQLFLDMLVTHPNFRRRGAGTMLCNWGRDEAVRKGWTLTVMASPMGRFLYEHLGYTLVGSEKVQADGEDEQFDIDSLVKRVVVET